MPAPSRSLMELVDHVEMEHERELAPGTTERQIRSMHRQMHERGDHWTHSHVGKKVVYEVL